MNIKATVPFLSMLLLATTGVASIQAAIVDDMNWADRVVEWEGALANYGINGSAQTMTEATSWWLTGPPDTDANDNGYALDGGVDRDTIAGWRNCGSNPSVFETFILQFDTAIEDGEEDDLAIVGFGGARAGASVLASTDGIDYVEIGQIDGGIPGSLVTLWFDFDGGINNVHYVKVLRTASGSGSGYFFDAVGGLVREASELPGDLNDDGFVGSADLDIVRANWGQSVDAGCLECGDPSGDGSVGSADLDIVRANWGEGSPVSVPEPLMPILVTLGVAALIGRQSRVQVQETNRLA